MPRWKLPVVIALSGVIIGCNVWVLSHWHRYPPVQRALAVFTLAVCAWNVWNVRYIARMDRN